MDPTSEFQFSNFNQISTMVYRLGFALTKSKVDADDVYQEVFLSYFNSGIVFESLDHQKAWFIVVTKNACKKLWRNPLYRLKVDKWDDRYAPATTSDYSDLHQALSKLDIHQRTIIHLHYFEGYTLYEIAEMLDIKYPTVRKQMSRARSKLKTIYQQEDETFEEL